jgi:hypothetical protein
MKNRKGIFNFKMASGRNRARPARTTRDRPAAVQPQCRTGLVAWLASSRGRPTPAPTRAGRARRGASWPGCALSEYRGAARAGPPATEHRQGLHHDRPHATTHRCDRVGRLGSRLRKGAASKRISSAQLWRWGSPARKKWLSWSGSSSGALRSSGTCEKGRGGGEKESPWRP